MCGRASVMPKLLLGRKVGMTQIFDETGDVHAVTVLEVGPCAVLQVKSAEKDGYFALQLGFDDKGKKQSTKADVGHAKKAGTSPKRFIREVRLEEPPEQEPGAELTVSMFAGVPRVDIIGTMKGRGYSGVMKRHGFSGLEKTHGVLRKHRAPGSIGPSAYPAHVRKGIRMNGQYGNSPKTSRNIRVIAIDPEARTMLVEGSVPGPNGGYVIVRETRKRPKTAGAK